MSNELVVPELSKEPAAPQEVSASDNAVDVNDWGALSVGEDDDEISNDGSLEPRENSEPSAETSAPSADKAPVSPPPAPQAQTPAAPPAQPAAAAEPAAPVQTAAPSAQPAEPVQAPQQSPEEQLAARMAQLATAYAIPADEVTSLLTEPETVLPKLAARVHQNIVTEMWQSMQGALPHIVANTVQGMLREQEAKTAFFTAWPELRPYEAQVKQAGMFYRSMNPKASADEAIKAIGELAMAALGLSRNVQPPAQPAPQQPAARPAAFAPGGVGSAGAPIAPPEQNPFTAMAFDTD